MIGCLFGKIEEIYQDYILLNVQDVGYLVYCSYNTISELEKNQKIKLFIETHVREDHIHLYGFLTMQEKDTYIILRSVKGVGNKMALNILSSLKPEAIYMSLASSDSKSFESISGVGKKLAQRIITELKDKAGDITINQVNNISNNDDNNDNVNNINNKNNNRLDAINALVSLGINRLDAINRIDNLLKNNNDINLNDLITQSLKENI